MQIIDQISWGEFPLSCLFYVLASGVDQLLVFALGALVLYGWRTRFDVRDNRPMKRWCLFNLSLLLAGAIVSGFWDVGVSGRFYVTADYFSDFSPFVPISRRVLGAHFDQYIGHLKGVTIGQLQMIWGGFAIVAWGIAAAIYFAVGKALSKSPVLMVA